MRYFWVFQNKNYEEESNGSYLWAPKKNLKGKTFHYWSRMEDVEPGDIIFSCVNRNIVSINIAKKDENKKIRPNEKEKARHLDEDGWIVLVEYNQLKNSIKIDDFLENIMKMQDEKYAPLNTKGKANSGYLYPINDSLGDYLIDIICKNENDIKSLNEVIRQKYISNLPYNEVKIKAKKAKGKVKSKTNKVIEYDRNPYVVEYSRRRANGVCELCSKDAPFKNSKGEPYLEVHHIIWLSKGGEDNIKNTVALCPNCHRKMHVLNLNEDIETLSSKRK